MQPLHSLCWKYHRHKSLSFNAFITVPITSSVNSIFWQYLLRRATFPLKTPSHCDSYSWTRSKGLCMVCSGRTYKMGLFTLRFLYCCSVAYHDRFALASDYTLLYHIFKDTLFWRSSRCTGTATPSIDSPHQCHTSSLSVNNTNPKSQKN